MPISIQSVGGRAFGFPARAPEQTLHFSRAPWGHTAVAPAKQAKPSKEEFQAKAVIDQLTLDRGSNIRERIDDPQVAKQRIQQALWAGDPDTAEHCERVRDLSLEIGKALKLSQPEMETLEVSALGHDVGKLCLDGDILHRPGKTDMAYVNQHVPLGVRILRRALNLPKTHPGADVPHVVGAHHELFDGSGKPRGLKGNAIPKLARIITVADVWDAMTSVRSYRVREPFDQMVTFMQAQSKKMFDPKIVDAFFQVGVKPLARIMSQSQHINKHPLQVEAALKPVPEKMTLNDFVTLKHQHHPSGREQRTLDSFDSVYRFAPIQGETLQAREAGA